MKGDDGVHGAELWKSNGTAKGTQLVKDIGILLRRRSTALLYNLVSFKGKLYFHQSSGVLWSSDGTVQVDDAATPVDDVALNDVCIY